MPTMTTLVDGTVPVAADFNGNFSALNQAIGTGTAITTYTTGDMLYASAANTLSKLAIGSNAAFMQVASGLPAWTTSPVFVNIVTNSGTNLTLAPGGAGDTILFKPGGSTTALTVANTGTTLGTNLPVIPGAVSGTPLAGGLYSDNVPKGWVSTTGGGTPSISQSFNVSSVTDAGAGTLSVTWDRDFSAGTYMAICSLDISGGAAMMGAVATRLTTSCSALSLDAGGNLSDPQDGYHVLALGAQ